MHGMCTYMRMAWPVSCAAWLRLHTLPPLDPLHLPPYALAASPAHAAMLRGYLDDQMGEEETAGVERRRERH